MKNSQLQPFSSKLHVQESSPLRPPEFLHVLGFGGDENGSKDYVLTRRAKPRNSPRARRTQHAHTCEHTRTPDTLPLLRASTSTRFSLWLSGSYCDEKRSITDARNAVRHGNSQPRRNRHCRSRRTKLWFLVAIVIGRPSSASSLGTSDRQQNPSQDGGGLALTRSGNRQFLAPASPDLPAPSSQFLLSGGVDAAGRRSEGDPGRTGSWGRSMERGSEGVAPVDPFEECGPWLEHKYEEDDDSRASSNFSSCGESEFDRYCSANSVLGSASVCSSVGNHSEFLDAFKSFGHGEDSLSEGSGVRERLWRNRRHGDRHDGLSDGEGEPGRGDSVAVRDFSVRGSDELMMRTRDLTGLHKEDLMHSSLRTASESEKLRLPSYGNTFESPCSSAKAAGPDNDHGFSRKLGFSSQGSTSDDQLRTEMIPDEDGSSGYEHSEDEDSMLDYGTDAEDGIHENRNVKFHSTWKDRPVNENPLLINSSVAFGSDDWNDFVQETEVNALHSVPLCGETDSKPQDGHFEMEGNILKLPYTMRHLDKEKMEQENARYVPEASHHIPPVDKSTHEITDCPVRNSLMKTEASTTQRTIVSVEASVVPCAVKKDQDAKQEVQDISQLKFVHINEGETATGLVYAKSEHSLISKHDKVASQFHCIPVKEPKGKEMRMQEESKVADLLPKVQTSHEVADVANMNGATNQVEKQEPTEFYDEMVLEMEEILLDSGELHGGRLLHGSQAFMSQKSYHTRDGSSTASTSGTDDVYMGNQNPLSIDWIEIIGAKQKKGDVSFGERLVGVKEYTVYKIRVQSGKDQWEVERRYRDFVSLYRQLKALFSDHGLLLPSPWMSIERESRNIFGNSSPSVISLRSILIQDCLRSVLHFRFPLGNPSPLVWFLSPVPSKDSFSSGISNALYRTLQKVSSDVRSNSSNCEEYCTEDVSTLGKMITLIVDTRVRKSVRQLLEAQRYMCAGCHQKLDVGKTLMKELVHTLGWGKPRLCEYTGQLFCLTCHTNDTAVLPARVLHHWDFSLYPVSQLAKAYLDSIYEQPMLCVSAVNPFLFSKVPALLHIMGMRKKIASMLPYVRCPFRRSIHRGLGTRRYLLEDNEFFALRDLVDLSKGAFAVCPRLGAFGVTRWTQSKHCELIKRRAQEPFARRRHCGALGMSLGWCLRMGVAERNGAATGAGTRVLERGCLGSFSPAVDGDASCGAAE
ncbi:hypothetical protein Taro_029264 [Colocasia esculenta]|uniref:PX domain-containing protein n=1 Tax=Colocasia esculenta TaxID=4460 RepID=A0A843VNK1_COLES|nr:hypothetical protein [Colocasia esculenta]